MKTKSLDAILTLALILTVVSGFAHTWQQTSTLTPPGSTGMSADGRIICIVGSDTFPRISTDSGQTWIKATNAPGGGVLSWTSVAVSADGGKIFAALSTNLTSAWVFVSSDQGTNWQRTGFPSNTWSARFAVACSADGTKVIEAAGAGPIYYSTNGGIDCYTSSVPAGGYWLASSADGSRMFASDGPAGLYFSSDFGVNWTPVNPALPALHSVCTSSDGKSIGLTVYGETLISSDGGSSWRTNTFGGDTIACSANGTNWIIAGNQIYTSVDAGLTWVTNLAGGQWVGGVVSADGAEMAADGAGEGTWIGRLTPSPQLSIRSQNSGMALSWLIPSTNFVLQQSADLANPAWTPVAMNPTLNFTNLNQQVTVPANGSNTFFRLSAQ